MILDINDIIKAKEDDWFIYAENKKVKLRTNIEGVLRFQKFIEEHSNFESFSAGLNTDADFELLMCLIESDEQSSPAKFLYDIREFYGLHAGHLVLNELFSFWYKQAFAGLNIEQAEQQTKQKK
ncbi:hypothetical protein BCF59_0495 [Mycoplasmopsis mustelae]|uniref:Uncharacterized protein n=1 Tax=Mycoplasmopsis mustelae TaxID=171289 RepID=A0A4R7UC63_9BACT|nr:hypothetical protein [Mycoplasmopsis mustelae]TDV23506.1 hypothetical protein BCF59_0495 [Mycoplasmopsis mustelae]